MVPKTTVERLLGSV